MSHFTGYMSESLTPTKVCDLTTQNYATMAGALSFHSLQVGLLLLLSCVFTDYNCVKFSDLGSGCKT